MEEAEERREARLIKAMKEMVMEVKKETKSMVQDVLATTRVERREAMETIHAATELAKQEEEEKRKAWRQHDKDREEEKKAWEKHVQERLSTQPYPSEEVPMTPTEDTKPQGAAQQEQEVAEQAKDLQDFLNTQETEEEAKARQNKIRQGKEKIRQQEEERKKWEKHVQEQMATQPAQEKEKQKERDLGDKAKAGSEKEEKAEGEKEAEDSTPSRGGPRKLRRATTEEGVDQPVETIADAGETPQMGAVNTAIADDTDSDLPETTPPTDTQVAGAFGNAARMATMAEGGVDFGESAKPTNQQ